MPGTQAPASGSGAGSAAAARSEPRPARRSTAPRWNDRRVIVGALLVVCSVAGVVTVVNGAKDTVDLWAYRADLAPGNQVAAGDVTQVAVRVPDPEVYLGSSQSPVGGTTVRSVSAGELVSANSLAADDEASTLRLVTLPVERYHLPVDLQRGERVDVYVVERGASGEPAGSPRLVLPGATVADVDDGDARFGGGSLELGVALSVDVAQVAKVVAAASEGTITLVRVPQDDG